MLDLEYLNRFGKDLVSETDRLLQVKSAYEEINPEVLYKAELTEEGRNTCEKYWRYKENGTTDI